MNTKSSVGLAVAAAAIGVCSVGAGWLASRLIRDNRAAVIASLPLLAEQSITVPVPGELVVSIEVPRMATDYRGWELEINEPATKQAIRMKWAGPRSTGAVTGVATVKIPLGRLMLTQPGQLAVRVNGLAPDGNYSAYRIILARPHLLRMAFQITGLALCGVGMLLSLLWGLWLMGIVKAS